jgi:hypothetical protein
LFVVSAVIYLLSPAASKVKLKLDVEDVCVAVADISVDVISISPRTDSLAIISAKTVIDPAIKRTIAHIKNNILFFFLISIHLRFLKTLTPNYKNKSHLQSEYQNTFATGCLF